MSAALLRALSDARASLQTAMLATNDDAPPPEVAAAFRAVDAAARALRENSHDAHEKTQVAIEALRVALAAVDQRTVKLGWAAQFPGNKQREARR